MIEVEYFGLLAEITNCKTEVINHNSITISELKLWLATKYPSFNQLTYKVAINLKFKNQDYSISSTDRVAILPPFSGG